MIPVTKLWQGGEHVFAFPLGALRALEGARDCGSYHLLMRLVQGAYRVDDVMDVLTYGLTGGGMADGEARRLVARVMAERAMSQLALLAVEILSPFIIGDPFDPAEEPGEQKTGAGAIPTLEAEPASQNSMAQEP
jgi:Phage tail tube protein, GTA-gp10